MRKKGCKLCRSKHLRCGNETGGCFNCSKRGIACEYDNNLKIQPSIYQQQCFKQNRATNVLPPSPEDMPQDRVIEQDKQKNEFDTKLYTKHPEIIKDQEEIKLFEAYVSKAGPLLDAVSDKQHFAVVVPRRALNCPVLYYACLAYSARVSEEFGKDVEEVYSVKCYRLLIKLLEDQACIADEVLLATTVILRMKEQFQDLWEDSQYHLRGCFSIIAPEKLLKFSSDITLRDASFWTYTREDIRMAILHRRKCIFTADRAINFDPGSDCMWTNIITYITVKLCNWAFGDKNGNEGRKLANLLDEWYIRKPESFQPVGFNKHDDNPIPRIIFAATWHNIGYQYYYFGKLLIASIQDWDPLEFSLVLERDILYPTRMILGAVTSTTNIGVRINGSHLAAYGGQYFVTETERSLLIDFLTVLMNETGWPCQSACDSLYGTWENQNLMFKQNLSPQPLQLDPRQDVSTGT